ncbi:MAG: 4-(cytidine 5'-diphospho)-2-C-methyl-D-erythritol kinase, partial [Candidatus Syntrophosphaera sp.]
MLTASYAKVNLFLEVLGELPGDYHEIETLLCSVSICDTIKYALTKKQGIKLWSNLPEMEDRDNLVFRMASYMSERFRPERGLDIYLEKRIPIAAGLGGGSSNAATTIRALDQLLGLNLKLRQMEEIAAGFGSDIAFFLHGGAALASNRGEIVRPLSDIEIDNILLVNPNIAVSSAEAYGMVR